MKPSPVDAAPIKLLATVRWPVGGIRTYLKYVYLRLDPALFDITVVAPDIPELRVLMKEMDRPNVRFLPIARYDGVHFLRAISRAIFSVKPDLVQSHGFTAGFTAALPAKFVGAHHVITPHDVITPEIASSFRQKMQIRMLGMALGAADVIQTVSEDSRRNIIEFIPGLARRPEKFHTILNGVPAAQFAGDTTRDLRAELSLPQDTFLVGFLGRFMKQKGFTYLLDAMQALAKRTDLARKPLVIAVGGGGHIREEQARVNARGLAAHFHFLPFEANVAAVMRGLDVIAIPSLWEACPLLPMEAMMVGTPVIGTDCLGLREVLQGTPSTVIPTADARALEGAIVQHLDGHHKAAAAAYAKSARQRFDVDATAASLNELLLATVRHPTTIRKGVAS